MIKIKLYYDKDAETAWLNQMCQQGWALKHFFAGIYTFIPCQPGYYQYQIDYLDQSKDDLLAYYAFLQENQVIVLQRWFKWLFLCKKSSDGAFEMYSDSQSQIEQYQHICRFFKVARTIELICVLYEWIAAIRLSNLFFGSIALLLLGIVFAMQRVIWKTESKIAQLKKEID